MIAAIPAIAVLWIGTGLRLWTTWRTPPTQNVYRSNRFDFTMGVVFVAASFTIRLLGVGFDEAFGLPNLGDLLWHLLLVAAGACVFLYTRGERSGQLIRHPVQARTSLFSAITCFALTGFWVAAPIHHGYTPDLLATGPPFGRALILYVVLFQAHFVAWIGTIAIRSFRGFREAHRAAGPQARLIRRFRIAQSQGVMALGALTAAVGAAVTAYRALAPHLDQAAEQTLHQLNSVLSYAAAFLVSVGFGIPVMVNMLRAFKDVRVLYPLWKTLTRRRAHLSFGTAPSAVRLPAFTLRLTTYRRDIGDALSRIQIKQPSAAAIVRSVDPEAALGHALAQPDQWVLAVQSAEPTASMARDLLEIPSHRSELDQFRRIAAAFNSTQGTQTT